MTVAISRTELSAGARRAAASRSEDADAARRMLAIALVTEGWSRQDAAKACAMDRQTLRDWVIRYNEAGLEGLHNRSGRNGPPPRLSEEQRAEIADWVEEGPDFARDGVVRWRCVDLQARIEETFSIRLHERTIGKLLRRLSFRRISVRPQHPQSEPEEQAVFSTSFRLL